MTEVKGFFYPRTAGGRSSLIPSPPWYYSGDLLTVEYRTDPARVAELLPAPLELADGGPRRRGAHLGRLAVLLQQPRGAARSGAGAVQGGVRGCPLLVPGPDLLPVRVHLGRQGLRHRPRHPSGLPQEARFHVADPPAPVRPGCTAGRCRRCLRRHPGRRRPTAGRGCPHPARGVRDQRVRERAQDGTPPDLPRDRGRRPRRLRRADRVRRQRIRGRAGLDRRRRATALRLADRRTVPARPSTRSSAATTARWASSGTAAGRWRR